MRTVFRLLTAGLILAAAGVGFGQPVILKQPANASVSIGATAQFRVSAQATLPPLAYLWHRQETPLAWATNAMLTLTNVQVSDAGPYTVAVTDAAGTTRSQPATLDVDPTFITITAGGLANEVGHWHGAAWGDYDNDGYPDVYIHKDHPVQADYLFHNNRDGTFSRLSTPIPQGLFAAEHGAWGNAWGDYDNDGHLDLFLANVAAKNVLVHNRGNGTFEQILTGPGADSSQASGGLWGDYDRDGYLDLMVINSDLARAAKRNTLYHNEGNGMFSKVTAGQVGSLLSDNAIWVFGGWVDADENGWPDFFAVAVNAKARLYENLAEGGFALTSNRAPVASGLAFAWVDYDNDGRLDVCVAGTTPTTLFHQEPDATFKPVSATQAGIPASDLAQGWGGIACGDYDNDGWVDLFVGGGCFDLNQHSIVTRSFLYRNNGDGTFTPVRTGSPVNDISDSMGVHWVDYNQDGFLDLFVQPHGSGSNSARNLLYCNNRNSNNWLTVKCVGTSSPRDGTGVKVRAKTTIGGKEMWQLRLINSGGTCWGGQSFEAHFGLGDAPAVDVLRVEWPSGRVQELQDLPVRQYLTVTEPTKLEVSGTNAFRIRSWRGMAFDVQASQDLLDWQAVATVTNLTGMLEFPDANAAGPTARFYRVMHR
jgi:hypothetical protein